jgi:hypothetical protein
MGLCQVPLSIAKLLIFSEKRGLLYVYLTLIKHGFAAVSSASLGGFATR